MDLIYNLKEIRTLLIDFYTLTGLRVAIFDKHFHELDAHPSRLCSFCKLVRTSSPINDTCKACDFSAFSRCKKERRPIIYHCHLGLTEIIVPIEASEIIIGYLMAGQIFDTQTPYPGWDSIYEKLQPFFPDPAPVFRTYRSRPRISSDKTRAAAHFMEISARYLLEAEKVSLQQDSIAFQIDQYILSHLEQNLDVSTLCEHFQYRKTNFYKITNEIYGVSIMKHIRQLRMQYARELLSGTNLPVSEVAARVGIPDYNYFTKVFRQEAHCTPRDFRKNNFATCGEELPELKKNRY